MSRLQEVYKLSPEKLIDIRLSIMEAVNNAMIHGNHLDANKKVIISEEKRDEFLSLCIRDQGTGFDPSSVRDPTLTENISTPGGRGLFLMKHLTDEMDYENNGNAVILRFKI